MGPIDSNPLADSRPLLIKKILENATLKPKPGEYQDLKELDQTKHVLRFSTRIAHSYSMANRFGDNNIGPLNRCKLLSIINIAISTNITTIYCNS